HGRAPVRHLSRDRDDRRGRRAGIIVGGGRATARARRGDAVGELITGTTARRVGVVPARNKPEAGKLAEKIIAWLRSRGVEALDESALGELPELPQLADYVDAIVTLGGDGMILVAARRWPGIPLLGINIGHLGFLAAAEHGDW